MNRADATPDFILQGTLQIRAQQNSGVESGLPLSIKPAGNNRWECARPGMEISWNARHAAHAVRGGVLCIVWGSPRCGPTESTTVATAATAEQILDRLSNSAISALGDIRGGYGILFVDASKHQLILAVDRFSIETLCFGFDGNRICFSDRADCVPLHARTISRQSLFDYAYFHCIPAPATVFRGIRRMEQGSHLCVDQGRLSEGRHWTPRFDPPRHPRLATLREEFRALIRDAVAVEAERGERLGCFLSGGTDSSTVAGMLGAVTGAPARTYSIGFDAPGYDEMEYARVAARHFGTDHHEYYVTADDLLHGIPDVAAFLDQPFGNSSVVPAYFCARMARADGVTRLLAGDGGDELFGGNTRYGMQQFLELYHKLPPSLRTRVIEPMFLGHSIIRSMPGLKQAAGYIRHARVPMPDRLETFNLLTRVGAERILSTDLLTAVDAGVPLRSQRDTYGRTASESVVNRMLHYDWVYTLGAADLPKVRGAIGMAEMSVGYPLLADEIADFSLRLPANYKVRNFRLRWFFKESLRGFLPDATLKKKKHGFGLPFGVWATRHAGLRDLTGDSLAGLERRGILRPAFRDELMGELLPSQPGYYGELAWILMMLEQWLATRTEVLEPSPALREMPVAVASRQ